MIQWAAAAQEHTTLSMFMAVFSSAVSLISPDSTDAIACSGKRKSAHLVPATVSCVPLYYLGCAQHGSGNVDETGNVVIDPLRASVATQDLVASHP